MGTVTVYPLEEWRKIELQIENCRLQSANFFETFFSFFNFHFKICNLQSRLSFYQNLGAIPCELISP